MPAEAGRLGWVALGIIAAGLCLLLLGGHTQVMTGDEPRYLMYATSLLQHGRFAMTLPEWQATYLDTTGYPADTLPVGPNGIELLNSVYLSGVLSPVAWLFGLKGLRAVTLLAGLIGLAALFRLGRRVAPAYSAGLAVGLAACSIPLLPYLHLFYMETFLFALVAVAWERLQGPPQGWGHDAVTATLLLVIPFVHLRGSMVAAVLFAVLLWRIARQARWARATTLTALAALAFALLVAGNLAIYGAVAGPVNTARPPLPSEWVSVLTMQLFNVRHGLLAYAPVWALGYAGLIVGALRGSTIARQGLLLAAVAAVTGVGINPGECWPARFWVLSMPMLTIGLALWLRDATGWLPRAATLALVGVTLVNSAIFVRAPNDLVENRQSTFTYQTLFDKFGHADPGLMLPVEDGDPQNVAVARELTIGAALFVLLMVLAAWRGWAICAGLGVLMLAAAADLTRVAVIPPSDYDVVHAPGRLAVTLHQPIDASYLQIGHGRSTWWEPPTYPHFGIDVTNRAGAETRWVVPVNQVISLSCGVPIRMASVTLESDATPPANFDLQKEVAFRFVLYRSTSWLRALAHPAAC